MIHNRFETLNNLKYQTTEVYRWGTLVPGAEDDIRILSSIPQCATVLLHFLHLHLTLRPTPAVNSSMKEALWCKVCSQDDTPRSLTTTAL